MHAEQIELARPQRHRLVGGKGERRAAELGRIDAEQQVVHDRIADEGQLQDLACVDPRLGRHLIDQHADRLAHRARHQGVAAWIHHDVADPAHQILTEADLRVHQAGRGQNLAARQVAQMGRDRGRADVDREAVGAIVEARPEGDDAIGRVHRDRDLPAALAERPLQALQTAQIAGQLTQAPLLGERFLQAPQIADRRVHVGLFDLDVVQAHDRIELDRAHLGAFPDDLLVHLAVGRHVDDHVAQQPRLAGQAAPGLHHLVAGAVVLLGRARRRDVGRARADAVLGELALGQRDLAAAAQRPAAAHRIDVDPEFARGLQQGRAARKTPAAPGRREDDEGSVGHRVASGRATGRCLTPAGLQSTAESQTRSPSNEPRSRQDDRPPAIASRTCQAALL
jgi:hypothetical protein